MDKRTKREKLEAMAKQTSSPEEARIAQTMLDKLDGKTGLYAIHIHFDGNKIIYFWDDQFGKLHRFWPIAILNVNTGFGGEVPDNLQAFAQAGGITY